VEKSAALYEYYLSHIDSQLIAPYKQNWMQQAVAAVTDIPTCPRLS